MQQSRIRLMVLSLISDACHPHDGIHGAVNALLQHGVYSRLLLLLAACMHAYKPGDYVPPSPNFLTEFAELIDVYNYGALHVYVIFFIMFAYYMILYLNGLLHRLIFLRYLPYLI